MTYYVNYAGLGLDIIASDKLKRKKPEEEEHNTMADVHEVNLGNCQGRIVALANCLRFSDNSPLTDMANDCLHGLKMKVFCFNQENIRHQPI